MQRTILVTGSCGLVGSEIVRRFDALGWRVIGMDNLIRAEFFGPQADVSPNLERLQRDCHSYHHLDHDIRQRSQTMETVKTHRPDLIVHAAAQPSHDLSAQRPFDDFDINAVGTLNLLEAARQYARDAPWVLLSTNKVYGDRPNRIPMRESATRFEFDDPAYAQGIDEAMPVDHCMHSPFGASKLAADLMVQEYGRYHDMPTCCLRAGCLTGASHASAEMHGFLSYLVKCNLEGRLYRVYGYKGKQVRDNLHARDVARCVELFFQTPSSAEVLNIGGGKPNAISILEAFDRVSQLTGKTMRYEITDSERKGDHRCYYSDLRHTRARLPAWDVTMSLDQILDDLVQGRLQKR